MRYHLTWIRMVIIKKSTINKCWKRCGVKGTFIYYWWECKLVQPLCKTVWRSLNKLKMQLPYDSAIPPWAYTVSPLHKNLQVANFQRYECAPVCQLLYCTTVLFKVVYCKIKNVLFIFCVCFVCTISVKSIINLLLYSTK